MQGITAATNRVNITLKNNNNIKENKKAAPCGTVLIDYEPFEMNNSLYMYRVTGYMNFMWIKKEVIHKIESCNLKLNMLYKCLACHRVSALVSTRSILVFRSVNTPEAATEKKPKRKTKVS